MTKYGKLEIMKILPEKSRSGFLLTKEEENDKLVVDYKTQGRRVKRVLPKYISINKEFCVGLGLSVGDGLNDPCLKNTHYNFVNVEFNLVKVIYDWLIKYFLIPPNKFQFFIISDKDNPDICRVQDKFVKYFENPFKIYEKDRTKQDRLMIQFSDPIFQLVYLKLFDELKSLVLDKQELRRSFIKGLFAAEGHIKHSVYNTIESIHISFNPHKEKELAKFILACLKKEGIDAKIRKCAVYFCNYENMIKFYLLGFFGLSIKKKDKFLRLVKNANISLHFNKGDLNFMRKYSQSQLGKIVRCSQSGVCKMLKDNFMSYDNLKRLNKNTLFDLDKLINKTQFIYIRTSKVKERSNVDFLIDIIHHEKIY